MKKWLPYIVLTLAMFFAVFFGIKYYALKNQDTVYITRTGGCYHSIPYCGGACTSIKVSVEEAEQLFLEPCEMCIRKEEQR